MALQMKTKMRVIRSSDLARCRHHRLDVSHWVPRHRGEDCGTPIVVVVCGNLDWQDPTALRILLKKLAAGSTVLHGAARGADRMAGAIARELGLTVREFHADWKRYGRAAGPIRNKAMLDEKPEAVFACFGATGPDRGTQNTMWQAARREIAVEEVHE